MKPRSARSLVESKTRWVLTPVADDLVKRIAAELGLSPPLARVVASRAEDCEPDLLLRNDLDDMSSPYTLGGIEAAIERLERALAQEERIFIHGDFDVDGLTSAALLYRALKALNAREVKVEIGDRARGHGLSPGAVQRIIDGGFGLLITTDCGISDVEAVKTLQDQGVDVIITDHHHLPVALPPAYAIINPRQLDCAYPNAHLAAVGVIYQTVSALFDHLGSGAETARRYLDLAMLGTVGDLVPLVRAGCVENRILVKGGLELLAGGGGCVGVRVLIDKLALDPQRLTAGELSYIVIPKLNAANRVGDPRVAFLLLTTDDEKRADYWADGLIEYNRDRQLAQEEMRAEAEEELARAFDPERDRAIVLSRKGWNPGVIGLVASDLVEKFYLPTLLISEGDRIARASARSIPEFSIIEALARHRHLFERYGGHHMAAGFSIRRDRIPRLKEELGAYAREKLAELRGPLQAIDAELRPDEISLDLYHEIQRLGPFGMGNRSPRLLLRDAWVVEARTVGGEGKHLKVKLAAEDREFDAIGFNFGEHIAGICRAGRVDLVFKLGRDDWNGRAKAQLTLVDVLEPTLERVS